MNMAVFRDTAHCSRVDTDRCFKGTYCLHHQVINILAYYACAINASTVSVSTWHATVCYNLHSVCSSLLIDGAQSVAMQRATSNSMQYRPILQLQLHQLAHLTPYHRGCGAQPRAEINPGKFCKHHITKTKYLTVATSCKNKTPRYRVIL